MEQKTITLADLEREKLEHEKALADARREVLTNPDAAAKITEERAAVQLCDDRIEAFRMREREEAEAEQAKERQIALRKCLQAGAEALELAKKRVKLVTDLDRAIAAVAETRKKLSENDSLLVQRYRDAQPPEADWRDKSERVNAVREELSGSFRSTDRLVTATLANRGLIHADIDMFEVVKPLGWSTLVSWLSSRTATVIGRIKELIDLLGAAQQEHSGQGTQE